jgi:hypothetical protein
MMQYSAGREEERERGREEDREIGRGEEPERGRASWAMPNRVYIPFQVRGSATCSLA